MDFTWSNHFPVIREASPHLLKFDLVTEWCSHINMSISNPTSATFCISFLYKIPLNGICEDWNLLPPSPIMLTSWLRPHVFNSSWSSESSHKIFNELCLYPGTLYVNKEMKERPSSQAAGEGACHQGNFSPRDERGWQSADFCKLSSDLRTCTTLAHTSPPPLNIFSLY